MIFSCLVIPFLKRYGKRAKSLQIGAIVIEVKQMYLQKLEKGLSCPKNRLSKCIFC